MNRTETIRTEPFAPLMAIFNTLFKPVPLLTYSNSFNKSSSILSPNKHLHINHNRWNNQNSH